MPRPRSIVGVHAPVHSTARSARIVPAAVSISTLSSVLRTARIPAWGTTVAPLAQASSTAHARRMSRIPPSAW
jgi:hypothetical protein